MQITTLIIQDDYIALRACGCISHVLKTYEVNSIVLMLEGGEISPETTNVFVSLFFCLVNL